MWTIRKYKEIQPRTSDNQEMESEEHAQADEVSSRSTTDIEKAEKEDRARMAAKRRAQIMAQMASAQKSFMSTNAELFEATATATQEKFDNMEWQEEDNNQMSQCCLGPNRKHHFVEDQIATCILCSEDAIVNRNGPCMVYSAFVQKSNVLAHTNDLAPSPHSSTCGHVMHANCWKEYFNNEVLKENRRPNRNRAQGNFTTDKKEFLCPLCRCLSNAVIPISPPLTRLGQPTQQGSNNGTAPTSTEAAIVITMTPDEVLEPIDFDKWLCFVRSYNHALQQITDLTEVTDDASDCVNRFPDIKPIIDEIASVEELRKLSPPVTARADLISQDIRSLIEEFSHSVRRAAPLNFVDEITEPHLATWLSCSYTIQALEMYLRALNKPLKGQMSIRQTSCLTGLIRASGLLITNTDDEIVAKLMIHWRSQLSTLFTNSGSCLIEWDLFKMLIIFVFMTPCVLYSKSREICVPNGTLLEYYLLKMIFIALITKIVLLHRITPDDDEMETDETNRTHDESADDEIDSALVSFYLEHSLFGNNNKNRQMPRKLIKQSLVEAIKKESSIFLRCSCLLFHFMSDIDLPDELYNSDGDTFEVMCEYLGLNTDIESYLQYDTAHKFMHNLSRHPDIELYRTNRESKLLDMLVPCAPIVRKLIALPEDYSDLINNVSTFTCPNNDRDDSRNPTMCLVCGKTLCSMTYCCQQEMDKNLVGACTYHANECGAGVGIFLRIRECEILLLGLNKGSFVLPPYLDKYGETDQGLRRGNPLTLCPDRYAKLHLLWLSHCLHEDIARSAEASNSVIPTQWQHL